MAMMEQDELQDARARLLDALRVLVGRKPRRDCDYETRAIVDLALGDWTVLWRYSEDEIEELVSVVAERDSTVREYPCP